MIHQASAAFADAPDHRTYWVHKRSFKYDEKKTECTAMSAKSRKTIMKPYKLKDFNSVTILSFWEPFKQAYDWNIVSEVVAMFILPFFTTSHPATPSTIRLTPPNKDNALSLFCWGIWVQKRSYTYGKAVSCLLNSCAIDNVAAEAAS